MTNQPERRWRRSCVRSSSLPASTTRLSLPNGTASWTPRGMRRDAEAGSAAPAALRRLRCLPRPPRSLSRGARVSRPPCRDRRHPAQDRMPREQP
jgi:hypothetical protein